MKKIRLTLEQAIKLQKYLNKKNNKIDESDLILPRNNGLNYTEFKKQIKQIFLDLIKYNKINNVPDWGLDENQIITKLLNHGYIIFDKNTNKYKIKKNITDKDLKKIIKLFKLNVVDETTTAASSGAYVMPLGRNPEDYKIKRTIFEKLRAFKKTQYKNGRFVTFDDCVKFNNNKDAQNGKCSQGAIDKVVKLKKRLK